MATPDTRNSIVLTKSFDYRGAARRWSNRYHFEGDLPTDVAAWTAFADLIVAAEKAIYTGDVTIVQADGFDASTASTTNPHGIAVFTKTYSTAGTGVFGAASNPAPGDCAVYLRYGTPARTVKNHPVYLANYFHGAVASDGAPDNVDSDQLTAVQGYGSAWLTGFLADGSPRERCGPRGAVATSRYVSPFIRHRDFPA